MIDSTLFVIALLAVAVTVAAIFLLAGRRRGGIPTGTTRFLVPGLAVRTTATSVDPNCDGSFSVGGQVQATYPATPAGLPRANVRVELDITGRDNVLPLRISPDRFDVRADLSEPFAVSSALENKCLPGKFTIRIKATDTSSSPPRELPVPDIAIDVQSIGFAVFQEPIVEDVDPSAGTFRVTFELECCAVPLAPGFSVEIGDQVNIDTLSFGGPGSELLICAGTPPIRKRFELDGKKEVAELPASFALAVLLLPPTSRICKLGVVQVE